MAGGYENEDRQAEMEELRRAQEKEARDRLEKARKELLEGRSTAKDPTPGSADRNPDSGRT